MLVHPVVIPGSGTRSWTVLGDDDVPVVPVDRFLAYLTDIGRSPNTVKAYAHDMKDLWQFLGFRGLDWREARLEDIGEFVAWLQLPPAGRAGEVAVLPSAVAEVSVSTVNRKLAAVSAFYAHQARNGVGPGDLPAAWRTGGRGRWKPFLHHVSKGKPYRGRAISLKAPKKLPRILKVAEMQAILDAASLRRVRWTGGSCCGTGHRPGDLRGASTRKIITAAGRVHEAIVERRVQPPLGGGCGAPDPGLGGRFCGFEHAAQPPEPVVDPGAQGTGRYAELGRDIGVGTVAQDRLDHRIAVVGSDAGQGMSQLGAQDQQVDVAEAGCGCVLAGRAGR